MTEYIAALKEANISEQLTKLAGKRFSDVYDRNGYQYVDLVQEGGGVLGIALVGYTFVLEQAGLRFFNLAGTSAGAINTLMFAALGNLGDAQSQRVLKILSEKDLFEIVDGDRAIRKLVQLFLNNKPFKILFLALNGLKVFNILKTKLGVNPGKNFERWISAELTKAGVHTLADLTQRRKKLPEGLVHRGGEDLSKAEAKLAIITSDITTHTKVEFPKMASLYWADPDSLPPAKLVRASMSIPFFFEPYEVKGLPHDEIDPLPPALKSYKALWDEFASYTGPIPDTVKFVDGGMLSNFPINVFHRADNKPPTRPTFGVRLSTYRNNFSKVNNLFSFSGAMISTMRQIHDYDFLMRNPDYKQLICRIDADKDFNWLDFDMEKEDKIKLFVLGAQKAVEFLECFDWEKYKNTRKSLNQPQPESH